MGFLSDLFGGGDSTQTVTNQVDVPDWLLPLLRQQTNASQGALSGLSSLLRGAGADDLVAGFTPTQQQAFDLAAQFASGGSPFLPTAQNTFLQAAQGQDLSSFLPAAALRSLTGGATGSGVPAQAFDSIGNALNSELLPAATRDALTSTAQGDFLFGGQGFDQAVQAAVRAAQPSILSTFGRGGPGAATGGLAQAAIGQAATDAFARQFGQERANQLSAANALGQFGLAGRGQQLDAAGLLGNLGLAGNAQQLQAGGMLADLSSQERGRQLSAAGALPQLGLLGSDVLSRIGGQQQALEQQRLGAPISAQQQLLAASLGGLPISSLLGSTQTATQEMQSNPLGSLLGLGLTGMSLFGSGGLSGLFGGGMSGGGGGGGLEEIAMFSLPRRI